METNALYNLVFAVLIGAAVGIEREHEHKPGGDKPVQGFGGVRTFSLTSALGFVGMHFQTLGHTMLLAISFVAAATLVVVSYLRDKQSTGITSEIAYLLTFLMGSLCALDHVYAAVFVMVLTVALLSAKKPLQRWIYGIQEQEINDAVKFAIISLIILPLLPKQLPVPQETRESLSWVPWEIINPSEVWIVVVLVTGIGFFGYFLSRIWGARKGILLTAISGGLASSTAVTMSFSNNAKTARHASYLAIGILLASQIMFPRILLEAAIFHGPLAMYLLWPFLAIFVVGGFYIAYLFFKKRGETSSSEQVELTSPLSIKDGLKFGFMYLAIQLLAWVGQNYLGEWGLYVLALVSGLTDVDAITINMAKSTARGATELPVAGLTVYLAAVSNTLTKAGIVFTLAPRSFAKIVIPGFVVMVLAGFALIAML